MIRKPLDDEFSIGGPPFAPMHRRLGAPLGGKAADGGVGRLIKAEQVADHAPVEQRAVRVRIGQVGRLKLEGAELVEDDLGPA